MGENRRLCCLREEIGEGWIRCMCVCDTYRESVCACGYFDEEEVGVR